MTANKKENRIRLDPLVHESLRYYIAEERDSLKGRPGTHVDEHTVVTDLTRDFLTGKGHFPPRTANVVEEAVKTVEERREEIRDELMQDIREAESGGDPNVH